MNRDLGLWVVAPAKKHPYGSGFGAGGYDWYSARRRGWADSLVRISSRYSQVEVRLGTVVGRWLGGKMCYAWASSFTRLALSSSPHSKKVHFKALDNYQYIEKSGDEFAHGYQDYPRQGNLTEH